MAPAPRVKQRCEVQDDRGEAGWQDGHGGVSWRGHASHNGQIAPPLNPAANGQSRAKALKLPTFLREYDKLSQQCAAEGVDHPRCPLRLAELELIGRERRIVERHIKEARFPTVKS